MNDALYIAATGMKAQNAQVDTIANNVANVNTAGFKRSTVRFGDLVTAGISQAGFETAAPSPASLMAGVAIAATQRSFVPGEMRPTNDAMTVAIQGAGFLEFMLPDGTAAFARGGRLEVNAEGLLALANGPVLRQRLAVGADVREIAIADDGEVRATDATGRTWSVGRLDLTMFSNPSALTPLGDGLYRGVAGAGEPVVAHPTEGGAGRMRQGYQEASNVNLMDEMVQLMVAQRAYEMNVKVIQAADEIAGLTNSLRK
jgi:flagellar basal-body rod protein FlgG